MCFSVCSPISRGRAENTALFFEEKKTYFFIPINSPIAPRRLNSNGRPLPSQASFAQKVNASYLNISVFSVYQLVLSTFFFSRHFRFGGMTLMDSSMVDMKKFIEKARQTQHIQNMTTQERLTLNVLLKKAIKSYKDEVLRYKKGEIVLWHLDSLYRNLSLANRLPFKKSPQLELKRSLRQLLLDYLRSPLFNILPPQVAENVTSNPCWYPEIEAIGRPGVKCILPPTSMALHYMFGRNAISITVNANPEHPCYENEKEFVKELEQCLQFVKDLLDTK